MFNQLKNVLPALAGKIGKERVREKILQALPFWVGAVIVGLVAVGYARIFALSEEFSLKMFHHYPFWFFLLTPVCFVAAWWLVRRFDPNSVGSGIPQVMAAIELATPRQNHLVDKLLSVRSIFVKMASTIFMIMGGATIGREGPTVQIAGSIFRKINQLIPASWPRVSKKNMILTGAAAGLAAAFNTPLGGIVFAVEELARTHISYFKTALFTAVIIAGITAQGILGPYLYLGYPEAGSGSWAIFVASVAVAAVCGLAGGGMSLAILRVMNWKKHFKSWKSQLLYVLCSALAVALVACLLEPGILGSGKADMSRLLFTADKHCAWYLPFVRMMGSVIAFTSGGAGGVFAPSLGIGAIIGSIGAELCHFAPSDANILILCGMVAFLTGVTRSPFTSAILVLEMTDRHSIVFFLMLAGMVAVLFANMVDKHSFYEHLKANFMRQSVEAENGGD